MKRLLLALGMISIIPAVAQEDSHRHDYDRSVYHGADNIVPEKKVLPVQMQQKLQALLPKWVGSIDNVNGTFIDISGPAKAIAGNSLQAKAENAMSLYLKDLGINKQEWKKTGEAKGRRDSYVYYTRSVSGHDVVFSKLIFRFTGDNRLVRVQMKNQGAPQGLSPVLSQSEIESALLQDLEGVSVAEKTVATNWVWFPLPGKNGYELRPAWYFTIKGRDEHSPVVHLSGYVDAVNGNILYRSSEATEAFDMTVKGQVKKNGYFQPVTLEPLSNLTLFVNGNLQYSDSGTGFVNAPSETAPVNVFMELSGRWARVFDFNGSTPSFSDVINTSGITYTYPAVTATDARNINAYYHVDRVHDHMKKYLPTFGGMDLALETNVDLVGDACNAYFTSFGFSINFWEESTSCPSFAEIGDIIYHEYGHAIHSSFYNTFTSSGMRNGALNEGHADVWALGVTDYAILGEGAFVGGGNIRRYDLAPKVYPIDIVPEVHADGEIIAGAWWDVRQNIGSVDTMTQIFTETMYSLPDGPNGTEGTVFHEVLMSALMSDDNDGDLTNGTPHFQQIVLAFARHGIYLFGNATLVHQELAHQSTGKDIPVSASLTTTTPYFFNEMKLFYRQRGKTDWDSVAMTHNGSMGFNGAIPAQNTMGVVMDYYFGLTDLLSAGKVYFPTGYAPDLPTTEITLPYQFGIGIVPQVINDFEGTLVGWTVGDASGDNASLGKWVQVKPVGSRSIVDAVTYPVQTGADHTSGSGQCLVTANAATATSSIQSADVDGGKTTVITPMFDVTGYTTPVVEYYRWYSNDRSGGQENQRRNDQWLVQMRSDPNSVIWRTVDGTFQSDYNWRRRIFALSEYFTGAVSSLQVRFIASDNLLSTSSEGRSVVEAAVDDFIIYDLGFPANIANNPKDMLAEIFPNPAVNEVHITLPKGMEGEIKISDLTGKTVASQVMNTATVKYSFSTKELAAGTYMVIINSGKMIQSKKLIVNH